MGTPSWAGPLTTCLRGLWVSGYLPRAMADRAQGRRPDNRPGGDDSDPGLASRRELRPNCHKRRYSQTSVDCIIREKGRGPEDPTMYEGQGPENPSVVAPFAVASCRGNCRRAVLRRLMKFDLRPCLPLLLSSLSVLGCTGLMRSVRFRRLPISSDGPRIQFIDKVLNFPVVLWYVVPTVLLFGLT